MLSRKGRRLLAAAIATLTGAIAACSSSSTSSTSQPPATSSAAGSATTTDTTSQQGSATPTPSNPSILDPFLYPEADTPLTQANAQLKQIWTPYQVTIIPSRHTLENMPPVRQVTNLTNGALDDTTAQNFVVGEYRANAFSGWAERFAQADFFNTHLQQGLLTGTAPFNALKSGQGFNDPACDLYPTHPVVVKLDDTTTSYFTNAQKRKLNGVYAIVQTYVGPCEVTLVSPGPTATPIGSVPLGGATDLIAGHLAHDPVLGDLWFADGSFDCAETRAPAPPKELCQAAAIG